MSVYLRPKYQCTILCSLQRLENVAYLTGNRSEGKLNFKKLQHSVARALVKFHHKYSDTSRMVEFASYKLGRYVKRVNFANVFITQ